MKTPNPKPKLLERLERLRDKRNPYSNGQNQLGDICYEKSCFRRGADAFIPMIEMLAEALEVYKESLKEWEINNYAASPKVANDALARLEEKLK